MKNIKKSIFLNMILVASVSGMEELASLEPIVAVMSGVQTMILSIDAHQKEQQRATQVHEQSQQIDMENHQLEQQIAYKNHRIHQQQAQDNLKRAHDNHQLHQEQAKFRQQVDSDHHAADQGSVIDNQLRDLAKQRRKHESEEADRWVAYHENQTKVALAQAEKKRIKAESEKDEAENAFKQCLVNNRYSSDLETSGLPKKCHDVAAVFALYFGYSVLQEEIADYNKTRELLHDKE